MRASYQICRVVKVQQSRTEFEWVWSLVFGHAGKSQMEKVNLLTLCHIKLLIIRTSTLSPALIPAPSTRSAWVGGKYYNAACLISITFGLKQRNTYTFPSEKKNLYPLQNFLIYYILFLWFYISFIVLVPFDSSILYISELCFDQSILLPGNILWINHLLWPTVD